jgi:hypothetical protein
MGDGLKRARATARKTRKGGQEGERHHHGDYCSRCNGTGVDPDMSEDDIGSCDVCGGTGSGKDERGE